MENNRKNLVWGVVLVLLGITFLGNNLHWFDISFRSVARFWPLVLILAGVNKIISKNGSGTGSLTALLLAFAIPLAIFSSVSHKIDRVKDDFAEGFSDGFEGNKDEKGNRDYDEESESSSNNTKQSYMIDMKTAIAEASLDFGGGAGKFKLQESTSNLFDATTNLTQGSYTMSHDEKNNAIELKMKGKSNSKNDKNNINFDLSNDFENHVDMKLNTTPVWKLKFGVGAGGADLDLSNFKVKELQLEAGAAEAEIKLGDKLERTDVKISTGVSSVKIQVPTGVGCQIKIDGALNSKDFDGFEKIKSGFYQTTGFDKASKKIVLDVDSGLSSLEVKRY